jgi:hypothetical protein
MERTVIESVGTFACRCAAAALLVRFCCVSASAAPRSLEFDLRDSDYYFQVPRGVVGPWKSEKLDLASASDVDLLTLHAVTTNRLGAGGGHGEFLRIEDDRRFGTTQVRLAVGTGAGVLGQRTVTLGVAQSLDRRRRVRLTAGIDLTSFSPATFQRVVGVGPEVALGATQLSARYFHASTTNGAIVAPASGTVAFSFPAIRAVRLTASAFFGGEVNSDRTSSFLPTSSGRYGTDLALGARAALASNIALFSAYEGGVFRVAPAGGLSRVQHVVTLGVGYLPIR